MMRNLLNNELAFVSGGLTRGGDPQWEGSTEADNISTETTDSLVNQLADAGLARAAWSVAIWDRLRGATTPGK